MNFLPKSLIGNEYGYEKSTQDILKTIDFVEKAQKKQEDRAREKLRAKRKHEEKEKNQNFWDKLFANFNCGQCGGSNLDQKK